MIRPYWSTRVRGKTLTLEEIYTKLQNLFVLFRGRDYFKGKARITQDELPESFIREAAVGLTFQVFPIEAWSEKDITEDNIFDTIEFLYDHVSKPGEWVGKTDHTNWNYYDYDGYYDEAGQEEFRSMVNAFLAAYKTGYELTTEGTILALGTDGLQHILNADIVPYDEANVDSKVRHAISKWRNRHSSLSEKKASIRDLADVFEWLKKTKGLAAVLDKKDESALFDIANKFGIRHHNPDQKTNYDPAIWYSWIFHFYLATYHAAVRLLIKKEKDASNPTNESGEREKPSP